MSFMHRAYGISVECEALRSGPSTPPGDELRGPESTPPSTRRANLPIPNREVNINILFNALRSIEVR